MPVNLLEAYLKANRKELGEIDAGVLSYLANINLMAKASPLAARVVVQELQDQKKSLKLIASENYSSLAVQCSMANLLTDKYAEGVPGSRFYAGCENVDVIERHARKLACDLFGADHAYVQPHSGADANLVAFWAILAARVESPALAELGQTDPANLSNEEWESVRRRLGSQKILGLELRSGGHLTHGYRRNVSGKMFEAHTYTVNHETGLLDYSEIEALASELKPLILLAGYSAYPRRIDFSRLRQIADKVGAVLMVDMAHFAGLVAGKVFREEHDPVPFADVVTTTTHKTLRGPRGGLVLCKSEFAEQVDKGCPLIQGGPLSHVIVGKAICFEEALRPQFREYASRVVQNAQHLSQTLVDLDQRVMTGGTDNHLVLIDVTPFGLTGRQAETALRECGITLNRNTIPGDLNGPWYTSGLRLGTAAVTTVGMGEAEMESIARILNTVIRSTVPVTTESGNPKVKFHLGDEVRQEARASITQLLQEFPVYPELDADLLADYLGLKHSETSRVPVT